MPRAVCAPSLLPTQRKTIMVRASHMLASRGRIRPHQGHESEGHWATCLCHRTALSSWPWFAGVCTSRLRTGRRLIRYGSAWTSSDIRTDESVFCRCATRVCGHDHSFSHCTAPADPAQALPYASRRAGRASNVGGGDTGCGGEQGPRTTRAGRVHGSCVRASLHKTARGALGEHIHDFKQGTWYTPRAHLGV